MMKALRFGYVDRKAAGGRRTVRHVKWSMRREHTFLHPGCFSAACTVTKVKHKGR